MNFEILREHCNRKSLKRTIKTSIQTCLYSLTKYVIFQPYRTIGLLNCDLHVVKRRWDIIAILLKFISFDINQNKMLHIINCCINIMDFLYCLISQSSMSFTMNFFSIFVAFPYSRAMYFVIKGTREIVSNILFDFFFQIELGSITSFDLIFIYSTMQASVFKSMQFRV